LTYAVALWGLGLLGGYWIAFHPVLNDDGLGARGLWLAASASLALAGAVLFTYLGSVSKIRNRNTS